MIEFEVQATGIPQPRPKARRIGPGIQIYTPKSGPIAAYRAAVVAAFKRVMGDDFVPYTGPLGVSIQFVFERPMSRMNEEAHIIKPDLDNLGKNFLDALKDVAWHDDSQVCSLGMVKCWADVTLGGSSGRKKLSGPSIIRARIAPIDPFNY